MKVGKPNSPMFSQRIVTLNLPTQLGGMDPSADPSPVAVLVAVGLVVLLVVLEDGVEIVLEDEEEEEHLEELEEEEDVDDDDEEGGAAY